MKTLMMMAVAAVCCMGVAGTNTANVVRATIETSLGNIELELDEAKAPLSVTNFMTYAKAGHYDGTVFHRVINGFMIQGGGFTPDMQQKATRAPIKNEAANGLKNKRGTIAMARTMVVDSATSQFFINHKDNAFLDYAAPNPRQYGYAVFGHVTKGMDVVDKIAQVKTGRVGYFSDVPVEPVIIKKVTVGGCELRSSERVDITSGLQREIDAAWHAGGGTVRVPAGDWGVRSIRLRSGVTLRLAEDAHLWASRSPRDYDGVIENDAVEKFSGYPVDLGKEDLSRKWENAIVKVFRAHDVAIVGEKGSFIDGQNCADPTGEEGYRGPHGIWAACATNVTLRGVTLRNTGNWSTRFIHCADLTFDGVTVLGGHDGVHVRASDRVLIANCTLNTGDDSVAGYANRNVLVTNCFLRSACSPVRFGGRDVLVVDCRASGPADYPHRWTLTAEEKARGAGQDEVKGRRTTGCAYQPFTDVCLRTWLKPGNIVFRNVTFENANHFMVFLNGLGALWQGGPAVEDITFENCTMRGMAAPSVVYAPEKSPLKLVFRNCTFACASYQPVALLHKNVNLVAENVKVENAGTFAQRKDDLSFDDVPDFPSWRMESNEQRAAWGLPPLPASR